MRDLLKVSKSAAPRSPVCHSRALTTARGTVPDARHTCAEGCSCTGPEAGSRLQRGGGQRSGCTHAHTPGSNTWVSSSGKARCRLLRSPWELEAVAPPPEAGGGGGARREAALPFPPPIAVSAPPNPRRAEQMTVLRPEVPAPPPGEGEWATKEQWLQHRTAGLRQEGPWPDLSSAPGGGGSPSGV